MERIDPPDAAHLRARLSAWARYVFVKNRYETVVAMARDMKHNQGALNDIMHGKGTTGLEFAVKLGLVGRESLDTLCLRDPAPEYFRAGVPRPGEPQAPPQTASAEMAPPRKRTHRGGR